MQLTEYWKLRGNDDPISGMKLLRQLLELYLKSSTHVALAVAAFAGITCYNLDLKPPSELILFIFFGTVCGYNFIKYSAIGNFREFRSSKILRLILAYSILSFLYLIWFSLQLSLSTLLISAFLGLITAFYAMPFPRGNRNLRSVTGIKIFVIAGVWAGVTVILPVLEADQLARADVWIEFIQRLLFVAALTLPFDIRDIRFDMDRLGTVPQVFGVKNTRRIGLGLLAAVLLLEVLKQAHQTAEIAVLAIILILTAALIQKSVVHQTRYFASFWVEAVPVFWWLLLMGVQGL